MFTIKDTGNSSTTPSCAMNVDKYCSKVNNSINDVENKYIVTRPRVKRTSRFAINAGFFTRVVCTRFAVIETV